jgi:coenzyme F420 biosynthesis associated uncharacterized protein
MIDWTLARRIGGFVAGQPAGGTALAGDLDAIADDARARIERYTGMTPQRPIPAPQAVDRKAWLEINHTGMKAMLDPLGRKLDKPGFAGVAGGLLVGAEIGALTGYLAQRVLGQYELVLLDADAPERLLMVAPNLRESAERLEVDEADLVTWVCVHEVTHAVQFTAVPWLREHLAGHLRQLLESVDVKFDPKTLLQVPSLDRLKEGGLVTLVAGPERMAILDSVQAAMAVVEGHAEHVMDAVGREILPSLDDLRDALNRRRREKTPAMVIFEKLLGLELKMKQYELGRVFCDHVVDAGGIESLNRVWSDPGSLPTLGEIQAPDLWLERTAPRRAA